MKRIFWIVLDSYGIGELPDAALFGDEGSNTLRSVSASPRFRADTLRELGLFNIDGVDCGEPVSAPLASYGRLTEVSMGKDSTIGHWELCGIVSKKPLPTFPNGFPEELLDEFSRRTGRGILVNRPYSGTDVIADYGDEHVATGDLIVYTSADSVFQIAAHEDVVPIEELYRDCEIARGLLTGDLGVVRVIARPFEGSSGHYVRTTRRHDYSLLPPAATTLNVLQDAGYDVISIGKINDLFAGSGISESHPTENNAGGMAELDCIVDRDFTGLCFANLVDFDMLYGHRLDVDGYAQATADFDGWLAGFLPKLTEEDLLIITADHGNDPGSTSTDHAREYVPVLWYVKGRPGKNLGTRAGFSDLGKSVEAVFGLEGPTAGVSFYEETL